MQVSGRHRSLSFVPTRDPVRSGLCPPPSCFGHLHTCRDEEHGRALSPSEGRVRPSHCDELGQARRERPKEEGAVRGRLGRRPPRRVLTSTAAPQGPFVSQTRRLSPAGPWPSSLGPRAHDPSGRLNNPGRRPTFPEPRLRKDRGGAVPEPPPAGDWEAAAGAEPCFPPQRPGGARVPGAAQESTPARRVPVSVLLPVMGEEMQYYFRTGLRIIADSGRENNPALIWNTGGPVLLAPPLPPEGDLASRAWPSAQMAEPLGRAPEPVPASKD